MTVQELLEILEQMDPSARVVIALDAEGTEFAPIEDYQEGLFNSRLGEFYVDEEELEYEYDDDYVEENPIDPKDKNHSGTPAVALWPSY